MRGLDQPVGRIAKGKGQDDRQNLELDELSFDRFVPTGVFPVGIDPGKFDELLKTSKVQDRIAVSDILARAFYDFLIYNSYRS